MLTMIIQFFATISPPRSTLARSPNDIINGGFNSRDEAVLYCLDQNKDIHLIFEYYGLNCDIISRAEENVIIKSTDYNKSLDSLGRTEPENYNPKTNKPSDKYTVEISDVEPLYMKNLWYWDTYDSSQYKVLKMTNIYGQTVFIMYSCGNIVTINKYTRPAPAPAPTPPTAPAPKTQPAQKLKSTEPPDVCPKIYGKQTTKDQCDVCPNIPGDQTTQKQCYPCPEAQSNTAKTACLQFSKIASNTTTNVRNADRTTAKSNDVITYTLSAKNTGNVEFKDFVFDENLSDVLEYAELKKSGGGYLTPNQHLVWPKQSIAPNESIKIMFSVQIKSEIPNTPVSSSDPGSYDLCMTNVFYGQSATICLKPSATKRVESATTSLPNTGPSTGLLLGFGITTIAGYFFARSRLFATEMDIVRQDFINSGGM